MVAPTRSLQIADMLLFQLAARHIFIIAESFCSAKNGKSKNLVAAAPSGFKRGSARGKELYDLLYDFQKNYIIFAGKLYNKSYDLLYNFLPGHFQVAPVIGFWDPDSDCRLPVANKGSLLAQLGGK
jgi:hypothetical protein